MVFLAIVVLRSAGNLESLEGTAYDAYETVSSRPAKRSIHLCRIRNWSDTIMAISELIEANPNDMNLRKQRAALLEQVG